jgi:large subunit ribosomal protein L25
MEKYELTAEKREVIGKKVKALRRDGYLPAIIYGHGIDPTPVTLNTKDVRQLLREIGANTLITIKLGKGELLTLVRDIQRDVIMQTLLHIDFQAVSLDESIISKVPLVLIGEAPATLDFDAVLMTSLDEVEVEAKAKDLPDLIQVDVAALKEIGDHLMVKDLVVPSEVKVLNDPEEIVVVATAQTLMELEPEPVEGAELFEELTEAELMEEAPAEGDEEADGSSEG